MGQQGSQTQPPTQGAQACAGGGLPEEGEEPASPETGVRAQGKAARDTELQRVPSGGG